MLTTNVPQEHFVGGSAEAPRLCPATDELLASLNRATGAGFNLLVVDDRDPGFCVCCTAAGCPVGIESAEISWDQGAGDAQAPGPWTEERLLPAIAQLLMQKDGKSYCMPYHELAVAVFTDALNLTIDDAARMLHSASFGPFRQITAAYLLLRYDPETHTFPVIALNVTRR